MNKYIHPRNRFVNALQSRCQNSNFESKLERLPGADRCEGFVIFMAGPSSYRTAMRSMDGVLQGALLLLAISTVNSLLSSCIAFVFEGR